MGTRETLRKAGWSALTLVMFLGFLEILCRRTDPPTERPHIQMDFDADLMWGLRNEARKGPSYRVNSLGLRGDELREGDPVRVMTLGDSSVYGHGVDVQEVFVWRLAERAGPQVEAVNGGVPGYSTFQSRRLLDRLADVVKPDIVVVGNLWSDAYRAAVADKAWAAELAAAYGRWNLLVSPLSTVSDHSALARRLRSTVHNGFFPRKDVAHEVGWSHLVTPEPGQGGPAGPPRRPTPGELPTSRVPLDEYRENLHAMVARAREAGALPAFLILPHPMDALDRLPASDRAYRDAMRDVAAAEGAPLIDGAAWFRDHPTDTPRFSDDIHPNALGHAQLGDAAYAALAEDPVTAARLGIAP